MLGLDIIGINTDDERRQIIERAGMGTYGREINIEAVLILIALILAIALFILWLWMLVDCLKRPDEKFAIGGNYAKLIWIIVIISTGFIGALLYYFLIKKKDESA